MSKPFFNRLIVRRPPVDNTGRLGSRSPTPRLLLLGASVLLGGCLFSAVQIALTELLESWTNRLGIRSVFASIGVVVLMSIAAMLAMHVCVNRRKRKLVGQVEDVKHLPTEEAFQVLLNSPKPVDRTEWKYVADAMVKTGHCGTVFVMSDDVKEQPDFPPPYPEAFEPIRLGGKDPRVELLLERIDVAFSRHTFGMRWRETTTFWTPFLTRVTRSKRTARNLVRFGKVYLVVAFSGVAIMLVKDIITAFSTGQVSGSLMLWMAVILLFPLLNFMIQHEQWYLVPGGLFLRLLSPIADKTRMRRYTAVDSLLIREGMFFCVSDKEAVRWIRLQPNEMDLLLSAWTSEIEPPIIEQFSDLQ